MCPEIVWGNCSLTAQPLTYKVLQISVLFPLLFNAYINFQNQETDSHYNADNTQLCLSQLIPRRFQDSVCYHDAELGVGEHTDTQSGQDRIYVGRQKFCWSTDKAIGLDQSFFCFGVVFPPEDPSMQFRDSLGLSISPGGTSVYFG